MRASKVDTNQEDTTEDLEAFLLSLIEKVPPSKVNWQLVEVAFAFPKSFFLELIP